MRIKEKSSYKHEYVGTCSKCKTVLEACEYEVNDIDTEARDARGECPICSNLVIFRLQ